MKNLLLLIVPMFSCQIAFGQDLQAAADDVCECFEEPYAVMEEAYKDMMAAQDHAALMAKRGEMMSMMGTAQTCFSELPEKYPQINENDELKDQVMAMVDEQCPNPLENFQSGN